MWTVNKWFGKTWRLELDCRRRLPAKGLVPNGNWSPVSRRDRLGWKEPRAQGGEITDIC